MIKGKEIALLFLVLLTSCWGNIADDKNKISLKISEVMSGDIGNNNHEFIEIYNPSNAPGDLAGHSLWYRLPSSNEDLLVYEWQSESVIPGYGHYLLVRENEDFDILPNATFTQPLNTSGGGLLLRDPSGAAVDAFGWGEAIAGFVEGSPAPEMRNGISVERLPGGELGNQTDTDDNLKDFSESSLPSPQNTGSLLTPFSDTNITLSISGPTSVEPGSQFEYHLTITNTGSEDYSGITVEIVIPGDLSILDIPARFNQVEEKLFWDVGSLPNGNTSSQILSIGAPWSYVDFHIEHVFARIPDRETLIFANPIQTRIEGGIIPISTARGLLDAELTVEGIATMYTGGYFAGSGNVKFYLEDETGGLQIQVFSGLGEVAVSLGSRVRVRGTMGVYRNSLQLVPNSVPGDVEIIRVGENPDYPALDVSIRQAVNDFETLPGRLIRVGGTVTRVEELNFNFDIDLTDDEGNTLRVYVDKLTEMTIETIETGHFYNATGILEIQDGLPNLYPRVRSDLEEIFPPVLMVRTEAPNTLLPGETFSVLLTATNHSTQPLRFFTLSTQIPLDLVEVSAVHNDGTLLEDQISWKIDQLGAGGESLSVSFDLTVLSEDGQIPIEGHAFLPDNTIEVVEREPWQVFVGSSLPIWAIQGSSFRSPYILDEVLTSGIVTGIFPELGGFWIQSATGDGDPLTSDGLFIFIDQLEFPYTLGNTIEVTGVVRETSQQTLVEVTHLDNIRLVDETLTELPPIELDPPIEDEAAQIYFETLEGMLVQITEPAVAVSPSTSYGEYALVRMEHGIDRVWRGTDTGEVMIVDDGSSEVHYDSSTLEYVVKTGDQVSDLVGPLAFTFGQFKIEPLFAPQVSARTVVLENLPLTSDDEFTVMTWNVENLFDILAPHPATPPLPRRAEYDLALTKIANTIRAAGFPIVIGLQEVEHVGILEDLTNHAELKGFGYRPILIEGTDGRGIDVGYLVRGDRATILDVRQFNAPEGLTSRPPLMVEAEVETSQGNITLFVLNNHFTSMAAGVEATEPRRSAQAAWNVEIYEALLAEAPNAHLIVLGDLNSFYDSGPIDEFRDAGLEHVFDILESNQRYTYIFEGASQTLDHILVTPGLMEMLQSVDVLHTNADYPPPEPDDPSPLHKSDHDPVIARFALAP
jgi:DNA/RNA endonuclease YhcR with UshA esterase domain/endonuclease/exonuclease/phosphatase family metal-dependent hydrolase